MSKAILKVHKSDFERVVLTDTLPYELPIIFSNEGFYLWLRRLESKPGSDAEALLHKLGHGLLKSKNDDLLQPLKYRVEQGAYRVRELALLHPASQRRWVGFYRDYSGLVAYYANRCDFSIRAPYRLASHVFSVSKTSDERDKENRLSENTVDVSNEDMKLRHPGSFFAYRGYRRLHQFRDSEEFLKLEQQFPVLWELDIANCFGSIYTHSVGWAIKSKRYEKENRHNQNSFGRQFDECMMSCNWRETNGIPVGPEVSRLFAEVILQAVDLRTKRCLRAEALDGGYEVRRYVDDYFVFAKSPDVAASVAECLVRELNEFGLKLSESKTRRLSRPYAAPHGNALSIVRRALETLGKSLFTQGPTGERATEDEKPGCKSDVPAVRVWVPVNSPAHVLERHKRTFIRMVKECCSSHAVGYEAVALYILSTLERYVTTLWRNKAPDPAQEDDYRAVLSVLLDVAFFFLRVHPTVDASFKVASISIKALRFLESAKLDGARLEVEQVVFEECTEFLSEASPQERADANGASVDRLNVVGILSQLRYHSVPWTALRDWVFPKPPQSLGYFQAIACLHYANAKGSADGIKELEEVVVTRITSATPSTLTRDSELVHLALDAISCPFLSPKGRRKMLRTLLKACNIGGSFSNAQVDEALSSATSRPWFTDWGEVQLIRALERKQATRVY